jgi:hypothetical protein
MSVRKRILPGGGTAWQVDYRDSAGVRRAPLLPVPGDEGDWLGDEDEWWPSEEDGNWPGAGDAVPRYGQGTRR